MSTATVNFLSAENKFVYGNSDTGIISEEEPEIRPRSAKIELIHTFDPNNPREEIKQSWNGVVIKVNEQEITARLEDVTNPDKPDQLVVLLADDIDKRDLHLVKQGALFYWQIGYRYGSRCRKERISIISFRLLAPWTAKEIQEAEKIAQEYEDFFLTD